MPARERQPGEISLTPRPQLSLGRLFKLEQEITRLTGVGAALVTVRDDGRVLVIVSPHHEARVREFLALAGELAEPS